MILEKLAAAATVISLLTGGMAARAELPTESPTYSPVPEPVKNPATEGNEDIYATGEKNEDGWDTRLTPLQLPNDVIEEIDTSDEVKDIIEGAGYDVPEDAKAVVITSADYVLEKSPEGSNMWFYEEYPDGKEMTFTFEVTDQDLKAGDTIYVLHQISEGKWTVTPTTVKEIKDGKAVVDVTVSSLSPIALVKIMSDGSVIKVEPAKNPSGIKPGSTESGQAKPAEKNDTTKTSPKTGV